MREDRRHDTRAAECKLAYQQRARRRARVARAILMQFAHPLIAAGVAEHSSFQKSGLSPLRRLHGTIRAMLALTFGDADAARDAAARINRIHDRVNGTLREAAGLYPAGTPYSAHDPHLLAWVQLTLLDTMPRAFELLVAPLTPAEKDAYCAEARSGARLLGLPDELVPVTYPEVSRAIAARLEDGALLVTDTARLLARDILRPSTARRGPSPSPSTRNRWAAACRAAGRLWTELVCSRSSRTRSMEPPDPARVRAHTRSAPPLARGPCLRECPSGTSRAVRLPTLVTQRLIESPFLDR